MDKETQWLEPILEALEDGIIVIDSDHRIALMNKSSINVFGEGVGKRCYEVINNYDSMCRGCRAVEVFEGKTLTREVYIASVDKTFDITELPLKSTNGAVSKLSVYCDITERKENEEKLRASETEYRGLFEHVGCGVFLSSKEGKFLNANNALLDMLGYESKEEFLNIDITKDLYLRPEDRERFMDMIEKDGRVVDYEVDFRRKDGRPISVLLTSHVRYDRYGRVLGYEGINVDQTQRKQMEKDVKEAHDFLYNIVQSSPNAIIATDMSGNIIIWNPAAEELLGYSTEDVTGKMNIEKVYLEQMPPKIMQLTRSPEYGGIGRLRSYPITYVTKTGQHIDGDLSSAILYDAKGNEAAFLGIFVDLEERLAMEYRLRRVQEQLLQSEKLAAMGRLISQIAHELNNPLYGIMNTLELLKTEVSPQSKRRKILEMALSETTRLTDMLRKMLSFSRPDQEEKRAIDINPVVEEVMLLQEKQLRENNIRLSVSLGEGLCRTHASKNQLRQVFLNMISNARDAMPEGGTLTVTSECTMKNVHIRISDTGIGIHNKDQEKIFDAFYTTKDSIKGVGLGLSVCFGFVKDHGGDIKVESEPGIGTTFTIILPGIEEATS